MRNCIRSYRSRPSISIKTRTSAKSVLIFFFVSRFAEAAKAFFIVDGGQSSRNLILIRKAKLRDVSSFG